MALRFLQAVAPTRLAEDEDILTRVAVAGAETPAVELEQEATGTIEIAPARAAGKLAPRRSKETQTG